MKISNVTNAYYPESKFLKAANIANKEFPLLSRSLSQPVTIPTEGFDSVEGFIANSKETGLTHLVIDNNENRQSFLLDVYNNEESFPYLIKEYDSREYDYRYAVKIFRIDYEKFSQ